MKKADGGLGAGGGFACMVNSQMCLETRVSKKVPMTRVATLGGFEASWVSLQDIGALFGDRPRKYVACCIDGDVHGHRVSNSGHIHNWTRKIPVNG